MLYIPLFRNFHPCHCLSPCFVDHWDDSFVWSVIRKSSASDPSCLGDTIGTAFPFQKLAKLGSGDCDTRASMILQESIVVRLALLNNNVLYRGPASAFQEEATVD